MVQPRTSANVASPGTNFTRIMDGVVDFRVIAYDNNGNLSGTILTSAVVALTLAGSP